MLQAAMSLGYAGMVAKHDAPCLNLRTRDAHTWSLLPARHCHHFLPSRPTADSQMQIHKGLEDLTAAVIASRRP